METPAALTAPRIDLQEWCKTARIRMYASVTAGPD